MKRPLGQVKARQGTMRVSWVDGGRVSREPADPAYPNGCGLDFSGGARPACLVNLTYPAPRCGQFLVECGRCGQRVLVTAAGRRDDPRLVRLACKPTED